MSNNYQSNVKKAKLKLTEEENEALKAIGKLLLRKVRLKARKKTGIGRKNIATQKFKKDKSLRIGIKKRGFYMGFQELGTESIKKDPFIMPVVEENKEEIQKIIKEYLGKLGN